MQNQEIPLSFNEGEEEITSLFLLTDLIKEYNSRAITSPPYLKKYPLSLKSLDVNSSNVTTAPIPSLTPIYPTISPMTKEEINAMHMQELHADEWMLLKKILNDQITPVGIVSNVSNIKDGVTILEVINELGFMGKVTYKTVGDKTYVTIKGLARNRVHLKGTRYLHTHPEMVRFGLAKVSTTNLVKQGFKTSLWIYGAIKVVEGVELCLLEDGLDPHFFSSIGADIPKIAIGSAVTAAFTAAATAMVVAAGFPVAAGAGIVLVVGIVSGIGSGVILEHLDQKIGLTEKLSQAADTMWKNLKSLWSGSSNEQPKLSMNSNLLEGLVFGGPLIGIPQITQKDGHYFYTA